MTKAEQRALEKYPANKTVFDKYEKQRYAFICGYIQSEKDLELTWEDLATIEKLGDDLVKHNQTPMSDEEFYKEVLKRFKERKKEL